MSKFNKISLCIYIFLIIVGLVYLINPYKQEKKNKAFEKMALMILDANSEVQVEYLENSDIPIEDENDNQLDEEINTNEDNKEDNQIEQKENNIIKEKYIGVLSIPKIDLQRGFYNKTSKNNTVNKNVMILSKSNYPDEELGNTILAAHNGNSSISYFKRLSDLEIGDVAYIDYKNIKYEYKLVNVYTQPKTGTLVIYRNNRQTTLTLITCTKNSKTLQSVYIFEKV